MMQCDLDRQSVSSEDARVAHGRYGLGFLGDEYPLFERYIFQRSGRNSLARNYNPHKVQWIGRRDHNNFSGGRTFSCSAQRFEGHGKRKLFSKKSADETPATNFSPVLQATIG